MKKIIIPLFLIAFAFQFSTGQNTCSQYYTMAEGATMQYTNYNKKGKEDGTIDYKVTNVNNSGGVTSATMAMTINDRKGNSLNSEYGIVCEGDVVKIDFESLMNEQMLNQFGDMEMEVTGTDLEIPNNLSVGQELPDANINIKVSMGGAMNMNMNVETFNRKVEKRETVTTPAGSFDCFVLYSDTKTKMMVGNQVFPSRTWIAEGIGMIKQESYNKSGKLMGSSLLTKFSK